MRYRLVVAVLVATFVASGVSFTSAESHPTEGDMNENLKIHPDGDSPADPEDEERGRFSLKTDWVSKMTSWIPGMSKRANKESAAVNSVKTSTQKVDDAAVNSVKTSTQKADNALEQGVKKTDGLVEGSVKAVNPGLLKAEKKVANTGVVAGKLKEMTKEAAKVVEAKKTKLGELEKSLMAAKQATKDAKAVEKSASALDKKAAEAGRIMAQQNEKSAAALVKGAKADVKKAGKVLTKVGKFWDKAKTKQIKLRGKARRIEAGGRVRPSKKMIAGAFVTVTLIIAALAGMAAMKSAANDKMVPLESMAGSDTSDLVGL